MNFISKIGFSVLIFSGVFMTIQTVQAKNNSPVSKDAVLAACRHTSGCSYDSNPTSGETAGCSPITCFYCKSTTCVKKPGHARLRDTLKNIIAGRSAQNLVHSSGGSGGFISPSKLLNNSGRISIQK